LYSAALNETPAQIRVKINAFLAIPADFFFKNAFILTRICHLGLHVWRGRLKSKTVKYYAEDLV
jgi:hypothetical protein